MALASVNQVCPSPLTKEIKFDRPQQLQFEDILLQIRTMDTVEIITSLLSNFEGIYSDLITLFESSIQPNVTTVLDVFNRGLGTRVLVIKGKSVEIDPIAVGTLFSRKVRSTIRSALPRNAFEEVMLNEFVQTQLQRTTEEIRPFVTSRRISLERLTNAFERDSRIEIRSSDSTDLFTQIASIIQTSLCNTIVSMAYSQVNTTLTSVTDFLDSFTVSSDNPIIAIIGNLFTVAINVAKQAVNNVQNLVDSFVTGICGTSSTSSRKRRDLMLLLDTVERSKRDTSLARLGPQDLSVRNFNLGFALIVSLIAAVVTFCGVWLVTGLVPYVISLITSWLFGSVQGVVSGIFGTIFFWL